MPTRSTALYLLLAVLGVGAVAAVLGRSLPAEQPETKPAPARQSGDQLAEAPTKPLSADELLAHGKAIYAKSCAECHGAQGEGSEYGYNQPLVGDLTQGELTKVIADTMPEGKPQACVGVDAEAVAAYIHEAFYSEAAQVRNRPPQIRLARLTAEQLRQHTADLYAHFAGTARPDDRRGMNGIYFDGSRWKNENKKIERVDAQLDFDWGKESPGEGIKPEEFYIFWSGGIVADVTGRYELVVRSTCSFMMDFGAPNRVLIDNNVQSGDKTEFRRTVHLTAGRIYRVEIDFRQRKRKTEQPPAKFSLSWVPPNRSEEVIPTRNLVPSWVPPTYSLQAILPPDDRSYGYERGIAINRQWDESVTAAALEFSDVVATELWPAYQKKHKKDPNENRAQLRAFLTEFLEAAFRGPVEEPLRKIYVDRQVDATPDDTEAIIRAVLIIMKSPRFLYPTADQNQPVSRQVANRLALTLFDSLPTDDWLQERAAKDELQTEAQVREAAKRLANDFRLRGKTRQFLYAWLNLSHLHDLNKDSETYPHFNEEVTSDLRASLDAFLDEVVWSESSDYRQFFLADWAFTTERLAEYYGESWQPAEAEGSRLRPSVADGEHRFGLLTHPYLMSGLAYHDSSSPIHRGVFLIRYMLGRTLRPPQEAFSPFSAELHPDLTTRERVALQTAAKNCQVCHTKINGLGFALENYDTVGRYRTEERGKVINPAGEYITRSGERVTFKGPAELARYLAESDDARRAFVDRAFQHFVKQPPAAYGPDTLEKVVESFQRTNYSIRDLLVEIAVVAASEPIHSQEKNGS